MFTPHDVSPEVFESLFLWPEHHMCHYRVVPPCRVAAALCCCAQPRYLHACAEWPFGTSAYCMVCFGGLGPDNTVLGDVSYFYMQVCGILFMYSCCWMYCEHSTSSTSAALCYTFVTV